MCDRSDTRRGAVLPLTAIAIVTLMAMLAFTVDIGYIVTTRMELQNAADAAALAAAAKLGTTTGTTTAVASACVTEAQRISQYNLAGKTPLQVAAGDVLIGHIDNATDL